jgi:peptidoglycan hydrolase FlgJ
VTPHAGIADISAQFALDTGALGNLKLQAKNDPKAALSAAAAQFEALFLQMLLKSMREALPQDGPLSSDTSKTYTGMFDQQVAQQLSKKGIGIADMLVKQLSSALPHTPGSPDSSSTPAVSAKLHGATLSRPPVMAVPNRAVPATAPRNANESALPRPAPTSVSETVQGFIDKVRPYAEAVAQKMGVPAHYLIAQAGLESGWGKSQPRAPDGTLSRNLFGIKATTSWTGATVSTATTEYTAGRSEKTTASFRAYDSYTASFQDFASLLQKSRRYAGALANTHDAGKYAASLQQAGYATDPSYAEKLTRAIQTVARYAPAAVAPTQVVAAPVDRLSDVS